MRVQKAIGRITNGFELHRTHAIWKRDLLPLLVSLQPSSVLEVIPVGIVRMVVVVDMVKINHSSSRGRGDGQLKL